MKKGSRKILLARADASAGAGAGHVMRCLALCQQWMAANVESGGNRTAWLASYKLSKSLRIRVESEGIGVLDITGTPASRRDAAETARWARNIGASWIALDGYRFGRRYQHALRRAEAKRMVIDDFRLIGGYDADLVLDQNLGAKSEWYREGAGQMLLGTRYVLLRESLIRGLRPRAPIRGKVRTCLVSMGGSDPEGLTMVALESLLSIADSDLRITVTLGMSFPSRLVSRVMRLRASDDRIEFVHRGGGMTRLLGGADLVVIAAGGTLWEACYAGCPVASFSRNPIQETILKNMAGRHAAVYLGAAGRLDPRAVTAQLAALIRTGRARRELAANAARLVDGRGAERVVRKMLHD